MDSTRHQAWKDSLSDERRLRVERVEEMPAPMAIAFVYDTLSEEIEAVRRPFWRQVIAPLAFGGAIIANLMGVNPKDWQ